MKKVLISLVLLLSATMLFAQQKPGATYLDNPRFAQGDSLFIVTQGWHMLESINEALNAYPPAPIAEESPRKMALYAMDAILHDHRYDNAECLQSFLNTRLEAVIDQLENSSRTGLSIYHIYDMGFIVQTKSLTVAIDVCSNNGLIFPKEYVDKFAELCDILFITHNHDDHTDPYMIAKMAEAGKPVIAPADCRPDDTDVLHFRPAEGESLKGNICLPFTIFPGHQNITATYAIQCNHYVLDFPEGYRVAHLGDQSHAQDNAWLGKVKHALGGTQVDVLMTTCWMSPLEVIIPSYDPKVVLIGHENEMTHEIDHRIAYWYTYNKYSKVDYPSVPMMWGDMYSVNN